MLALLLAIIIDADTLDLNGTRYRLAYMDAVELHQTCQKDKLTYNCGEEAKAALETFTTGKQISCAPTPYKSYGRIVARCYANGEDIGEEMVREGYAITSFSSKYKAQEIDAKMDKRGIWAGKFIKPQQWRKTHD